MSEAVSVLTKEQKEEEQKLITEIRDAVNASFEIVARNLISVKEKNLWVEYPSFGDWAKDNFGFDQREVDHYITGYAVSQRLETVDNGGKPLKLTHALTVGKFDEDDQAEVYQEAVNRANESGKKLTGELIRETGREMLEQNRVKLRAGVQRLGQTGNNSLVNRIIKSLPTFEDEDKARIFSEWVKIEEYSFLKVMEAYVAEQLAKLDV